MSLPCPGQPRGRGVDACHGMLSRARVARISRSGSGRSVAEPGITGPKLTAPGAVNCAERT